MTPGTITIADDGEILVRGPWLFCASNQARPLTEDGWYCTGDLGAFDRSGCLIVHGRKDNRFISGGENIQPEEIERLLCAMEGVVDAVVVPIVSDEYGEAAIAVVRMRDGVKLDAADIKQRLSSAVPRFKIPKAFLEWPSVDWDKPSSKIDRRLMAAWAAQMLAKVDHGACRPHN